ncbi:hypothetical protein K2173_016474 [Erythroxylum novogranatense]|uniref:B3 domain-containing transcription repressor VAL1 n=1 Tax=Erythroxylum novogranatense TaxID=1862640 RepID=A0AAV8SGF9_9ROSI|nr:hypothetical protein K2173_016474 [Erythroxylum novogranatense]
MSAKICMNSSCGASASTEWKKGWVLRSGGYADLCYTCGSAFENSVYCNMFHLEESGWRECSSCSKLLHCGCIASESLVELLDYGGIGCTSCTRSSRLSLNNGIASGLGSLKASTGEPTYIDNLEFDTVDGGKLAQLCRLIEANESILLSQSEGTDPNARLGQLRQEDTTHSIGEIGTSFFNATHPSGRSSTFSNPDPGSMLDMKDMCGSLSQPSLCMALGAPPGISKFAPFPGAVVEGKENGQSMASFQQGQRSRPILPKPSKPDVAAGSEANKTAPELRIARPPADGRGKSQLLPRYWPRITDQELQQLSGDLNSNIVPLFEKVLSASDAGRIGRLVLPKACAEAYFPPISQSEGLPLRIQDVKGREWTFQFRFWPNNNSRMYVLEGVTPCIQSMQLRAGDTITFSRIDPGGKLVIGYRKATNNITDTQDFQTSVLANAAAPIDTSFSADGDIGWNQSENNGGKINGDLLPQPVGTAEKKRTRNIGPKSKRLLMHSEDALELRLTWEEAQDLLRPSPSAKPSIVNIDDHEFEEYDEPPVFGKRTIFTAQPSGDQEQWAQCDDCSKWRKLPLDALLPPKWTCSENTWDSTRCTCSAPEEMSPKDLDNVLRVTKDIKKRRSGELQKQVHEREPSGLDALASAAVLGDSISDGGEAVGATTKHPRHRPGCTCIVCIQPPSGKGKHKSTCMCNVCMTVKRRFKTLMLRKKKRQSEREAEACQKDKNDQTDELETNGTSSSPGLHEKDLQYGGNKNQTQTEEAETSTGQIDLNSHPYREDMQLDVPILSMMNFVDTTNTPLDNYIKLNGLASVICEQKGTLSSCLLSKSNGESLRRLSDEALLASIGWDHENKADGRCTSNIG